MRYRRKAGQDRLHCVLHLGEDMPLELDYNNKHVGIAHT